VTVPSTWELERFLEAFDEWCGLEAPDTELRTSVLAWVMTRAEDPYEGVQRQPGFANLWFGRIPQTQREWEMVVCSYWVFEQSHTVRCDIIATLNSPV
jgi:hypothetical protein